MNYIDLQVSSKKVHRVMCLCGIGRIPSHFLYCEGNLVFLCTTCFSLGNYLNERKLMDPVNGSEYVPTYEDKDGDWMLVGDVPWK